MNNTTDFDERTKLDIEIDRLTMCLDFRNDVVVTQVVPALIAAFVSKLDTILLRQEQSDYFSQLENVGFLLCVESLLSTHGKEDGMIGDYDAAIRSMRRFKFVLRPCNDDDDDVPGIRSFHFYSEDTLVSIYLPNNVHSCHFIEFFTRNNNNTTRMLRKYLTPHSNTGT